MDTDTGAKKSPTGNAVENWVALIQRKLPYELGDQEELFHLLKWPVKWT
jgi:hypothetical protein